MSDYINIARLKFLLRKSSKIKILDKKKTMNITYTIKQYYIFKTILNDNLCVVLAYK